MALGQSGTLNDWKIEGARSLAPDWSKLEPNSDPLRFPLAAALGALNKEPCLNLIHKIPFPRYTQHSEYSQNFARPALAWGLEIFIKMKSLNPPRHFHIFFIIFLRRWQLQIWVEIQARGVPTPPNLKWIWRGQWIVLNDRSNVKHLKFARKFSFYCLANSNRWQWSLELEEWSGVDGIWKFWFFLHENQGESGGLQVLERMCVWKEMTVVLLCVVEK